MSIRKKILFYFLSTVLLLTALILFLIYTIFKEYREEQFQQRQKDKIIQTINLLTEFEEIDEELFLALDRSTIHDIYDEKLLLFDEDYNLFYESVDDLVIEKTKEILNQLSLDHVWVETKEELYDVVGVTITHRNGVYYGISKAYDEYGYELLSFLQIAFLALFLVLVVVIVWVSYYLSKKIANPIIHLTKEISNYNLEKPIKIPLKKDEVETSILAERFNDLMDKIKMSFAFQKNAVQHISHELNTPIAVLVSNFDKMESETDYRQLQKLIEKQKKDTRRLSQIINSLLSLSMVETGTSAVKEKIRVDEMLFDIYEELQPLYPDFIFHIHYDNPDMNTEVLEVLADQNLLRAAFLNLMLNSIRHSDVKEAYISIIEVNNRLKLEFLNQGKVISREERPYLFKHFFRGKNSQGRKGFGLGLVFIYKILKLHQAKIYYETPDANTNVFKIIF